MRRAGGRASMDDRASDPPPPRRASSAAGHRTAPPPRWFFGGGAARAKPRAGRGPQAESARIVQIADVLPNLAAVRSPAPLLEIRVFVRHLQPLHHLTRRSVWP